MDLTQAEVRIVRGGRGVWPAGEWAESTGADTVGCASVLVYMRLKSSVVAVKTVTQMEMRNGPRPSRTLDSCLIIGRQGQSLVHFP